MNVLCKFHCNLPLTLWAILSWGCGTRENGVNGGNKMEMERAHPLGGMNVKSNANLCCVFIILATEERSRRHQNHEGSFSRWQWKSGLWFNRYLTVNQSIGKGKGDLGARKGHKVSKIMMVWPLSFRSKLNDNLLSIVVEISFCQPKCSSSPGKNSFKPSTCKFVFQSFKPYYRLQSLPQAALEPPEKVQSEKVKCDYLVELLFKIPQLVSLLTNLRLHACSRRTGRTQLLILVWHSKRWFNFKADIFKIPHSLDQFTGRVLLENLKLVAALPLPLA